MASSAQTDERSKMEIEDFAESTKVVLEKVQQMDPENASKILGHLLIQEHSEQDVMNLAQVPDEIFTSLIEKTKEDLNLSPRTNRKDKQPVVSKLSTRFTPFVPSSSHFPRVPPVNNVQMENHAPVYQPVVNNFEYAPVPYFEPPSNGAGFHYPPQFLPLEHQMEYGFHNIPERAWNVVPTRVPVLPDMRFHQQLNEGYYPKPEVGGFQIPVQVWIQRLEMELIDILNSQGPMPVPIASLPTLYSENFGQKLLNFMQAKVGCGIHELLAQMSPRIRTIERPSGELCVMLAEDIPTYVKAVEAKKEQEHAADTSCQIFLTFSFRSTFTSQDVYDYFTTIGPVKGVRIPTQLKRMYGFVTFAYAATAAVVLSIGNPHFICGMQVLVKPYRGREILTDRKSDDNVKLSVWSMTDEDSCRLTKARLGKNLPRKQLTTEEHGQSADLRFRPGNTVSASHIPTINANASSHIPSFSANASRHIPLVNANASIRIPSLNANASSHIPSFNTNASSHIPSFNANASFHVPSTNTGAGLSAPRGVVIGSVDKGKSIVTTVNEEERYNDKGKSVMTNAGYNGKGKGIMTNADEEARYIVTEADDEARYIVTEADDEARYDDLNLPDSPFAFEASPYDFGFSMNALEWAINDPEF